MSYSIDVDDVALDAIATLPRPALLASAETLAALELMPWNGHPINPRLTPDGPVRNLPFGTAGMITYLIDEHDRRVDILLLTWSG